MTIFLLLSFVLVLSTESMAAPTASYDELSYDELRLALQWPTSFCNTGMNKIKCIQQIPREFTVHGLWLNKNSYPVNCPKNPSIKLYYQQIISHLRKDWAKYWPNLNSLSYEGFLWDYEYGKHGYCFARFSNPVVYFQTALDIYFETALHIATQIRNIMPTMRSSSGLYYVEDFRHVNIGGRKLILGLRCNYARNSRIPQLLEIVFCTDKNKIPKDCAYYVDRCYEPWEDSNGVVWRGWFQFPEVPASFSSSSRSAPDPESLPSAIAPCNSRHPPHIFFLLFYFYLFLQL